MGARNPKQRTGTAGKSSMNIAIKNPIEQKDPLDSIADALFQSMSVDGVYARTALFERVVDGLATLITRHRQPEAEVLRFPPVMSRHQLEKSGYLKSFPHLLGCVSCLHGSEADIHAAVAAFDAGRDWATALSPADLVLSPAACYPVYPLAASRGAIPARGVVFDVICDCFRHEPSRHLDRLQSFRMREYVCIGTPEQIVNFRERWMTRAQGIADNLGLPYRLDQASDPFFGRGGKLMATSQVEQSLKFELLIPLRSAEQPTACMSFNYHRDHFGTTWGLTTEAGDVAHTGCVAFGIDRLAVALFWTHGLELQKWPAAVREALSL
jgi:seryl-tRNA synthetase